MAARTGNTRWPRPCHDRARQGRLPGTRSAGQDTDLLLQRCPDGGLLLRGPEKGSMSLVPQNAAPSLPTSLTASLKQLVIERLPSGADFDLAVHDAKTGLTFFNIEVHQYDYDAKARLLSIRGRMLVSKEFADSFGRPSDAGAVAADRFERGRDGRPAIGPR